MKWGDVPVLLEEREGLYAFAKPAGMSVHPADKAGLDLITWLRESGDFEADLAPVHRLDRQTSGVVLCASSSELRSMASAWFAEGLVTKKYVALVHGVLRRKGIVRRPFKDARRKRPLPAVTRYRRREILEPWSLVALRPETGRKHQLRRHMHMIGHPIVGDTRYRLPRCEEPLDGPGRLWLHAERLTLPGDWSVACPLPMELKEHLERLREFGLGPEGMDLDSIGL